MNQLDETYRCTDAGYASNGGNGFGTYTSDGTLVKKYKTPRGAFGWACKLNRTQGGHYAADLPADTVNAQ